jgi:glycogen debranching enzyme
MPRRPIVLLPVACALALAACATAPRSRAPDQPPAAPSIDVHASPDALFDFMALAADGRRRAFFVGDHLDGYYSGETGGHRVGPGWFFGPEVVFQDAVAWADARVLDRGAAGAQEHVLPFGRRARVAGIAEDWTFHPRTRRLTIRVTSDTPARLAVQPLWATPGELVRVGDVVLRQADDWACALAASAPFDLALPPPGAADAASRLLRARGQATTFTVHLACDHDAALAADAARAMTSDTGLVARTRASWHARLSHAWLRTGDDGYDRALVWARASALLFEVYAPEHGLWAGLPWFRENWGRDTFISLPGTFLVGGHFESAREVLEHFARWQNLAPPSADAAAPGTADHLGIGRRTSDYGRIPNFVKDGVASYNTVDGTPWLLREALELVHYTGDRAFAERALAVAGPYIDGVLRHSLDADGLLVHDDADTWMDARIEGRQAWSPRGNRAIEIQALWYTALISAAELAEYAGEPSRATAWRAQAMRTREATLRRFWDGARIADRLRRDGTPDLQRRPNALLAITVPWDDFLPPPVQAAVLRDSVEHLLFPHGIASLAPEEERFHPRHVDDARHHKDAAYHNGTIWGWNAGFAVGALVRFDQTDLAWALTRNLGDQILHRGALGTMSELLDALPGRDGRPVPSGTASQAWSVAEFARNAFQDYVGFKPDLVAGVLRFEPALPTAWPGLDARLPFGPEAMNEAVRVAAARDRDGTWLWWLWLENAHRARELVFDLPSIGGGARQRARFVLPVDARVELAFGPHGVRLDGRPLPAEPIRTSQADVLGALAFRAVPPNDPARYPMTRGRDVLRRIILDESTAPPSRDR